MVMSQRDAVEFTRTGLINQTVLNQVHKLPCLRQFGNGSITGGGDLNLNPDGIGIRDIGLDLNPDGSWLLGNRRDFLQIIAAPA